jgi:hypothetical protein
MDQDINPTKLRQGNMTQNETFQSYLRKSPNQMQKINQNNK